MEVLDKENNVVTLKAVSDEETAGIQTVEEVDVGEGVYDADDPLFDDEEGSTEYKEEEEEDLSDFLRTGDEDPDGSLN